MEVTFRRTGQRRYAVIARPDRSPPVTMDPAPGFDPLLPHDLVHYAVEREHGIELGVFGQLAASGNLRTFRRLDGTPDRRLRRRGERLAREHHDELARSDGGSSASAPGLAGSAPAGGCRARLRSTALGGGVPEPARSAASGR